MVEPIKLIGLFWMERSDWDVLLPLFTDRANFPATYEEWRKGAETGFKELSRRGGEVIKVRAEPDEFLRWCRAKGLDINSKARMEFGNQQAAAQWFARGKTKH